MASRMTEYQFEGVLSLKAMEEALPGFPGPKTAAALSALWQEILASGDCLRMKDMAVNGGDLIAAGMKPGKEMGRRWNIYSALCWNIRNTIKKNFCLTF